MYWNGSKSTLCKQNSKSLTTAPLILKGLSILKNRLRGSKRGYRRKEGQIRPMYGMTRTLLVSLDPILHVTELSLKKKYNATRHFNKATVLHWNKTQFDYNNFLFTLLYKANLLHRQDVFMFLKPVILNTIEIMHAGCLKHLKM